MTEPFVTTEILTKIICSWFLLLRSKTDLLLRLFNTKTVSVGSSLFLLLVRFNFEKKMQNFISHFAFDLAMPFPGKGAPLYPFFFSPTIFGTFYVGNRKFVRFKRWHCCCLNVGTAAAQMLALLLLKRWHCCSNKMELLPLPRLALNKINTCSLLVSKLIDRIFS